MKLVFDANLSPRLVVALSDLYPNSTHVFDHGDLASNDAAIWNFAKREDYLIVTKDTDFLDLSLLYGAPPKAVLMIDH
jgi:predicted nuclease of predicted toxin-antitoxin system